MSHKKLFKPKYTECAVQCPSCPFRMGNNKEFGAIMAKLAAKHGIAYPLTARTITASRISVMQDVEKRGDFQCHLSAYDADMNIKPSSEFRQCKGATEFYRNS